METRMGLLIDYKYCTGCHACEVACKVEHGFPTGQFGIKVAEIGLWQYDKTHWQLDYVPVPTDQCDLCADRVAAGKDPTCVHHCQSIAIKYGPFEELATEAAKSPKMVLFSR